MSIDLEGRRLLLVEDEAMVAMMIEDQLEVFGCVVAGVAVNVSQGLRLAGDATLSLDGAILDVNLDGEEVYPVAGRLAELGVPFIFLTGYGRSGIAEGFQDVPTLAKPFAMEALEAILAETLANSRKP